MSELDWDLLHRYLAGDCTPDERERFEAWRDAEPERQALVASLVGSIREPASLPLFTERDRTETWSRVQQTIVAEVATPRAKAERRFVVRAARRWALARIAAAVAVLIGGAVAAQRLWSPNATPSAQASAAERVLQTPRGQRATFQLADGTRVILGPASTLKYAADYGVRSRAVRLEGEAYFAVTHDAARPFSVQAGDLLAEDLGTEFTVRAYPEDAHARVVVREGEVGVRARTAADATVRVLTAGQLGRLGSRGTAIVETVELDRYFAWTEGRLVFDRTPLREALPELGRWFDLDLRLADDALGAIPISTTLEQQPTTEVLGNVAAALGLTYTRTGTVVIFRRSRGLP